ncbi:MAG: TonB-dependent receptor [Candidatus Omnitrophica bacterium]|nr:TonB-dependent receptor [Candidatus Omnitrophota bacterium]
MRRVPGIILSFFLACAPAGLMYAYAQVPAGGETAAVPEAATELLLFENIPTVISASKRVQPLLEAPAAISVITAEDIKHMDYTNLWDLFRRVPGVDVATIDGRAGSVAPRGLTEKFTRRNQLLIDGRSAYSPIFGGTEWDLIPILIENIERIEVIRGPNATLYGSNAVNGVINIITKDPAKTKGILMKQGIGTHGYQRSLVNLGGGGDKFDYRLGYAYHFDRGYGSRHGKDINDDERDHTVTWRSTYHLTERENLELLLGSQIDKGRPINVNAKSATNLSHSRSGYAMLKYNGVVFEDQEFHLQFYHNVLLENRRNDPIVYVKHDVETRQYDFELQHIFNWLDQRVKTIWGTGFRYNEAEIYLFDATVTGAISKPYSGDPFVDRIYRLFFSNEVALTRQWKFIFGSMFEDNSFTGLAASPRVSLLFSPLKNHMLRLTYARAYRTPTMIEDSMDHRFSIFNTLGNKELKNEVVDAYELGYVGWFMDNRLKLDIQTYLNEYKNLVDFISQGLIFTMDNSNSARAKGLEVELAYNAADWITWYTNLTLEDIEDTKLDFKDSHPRFKVNFGSRFKFDAIGVTVNFDGYYVDTYDSKDLEDSTSTVLKVEPYLRFDFRVAKTFFDGDVEWAIRGENMFDQSHVEALSGVSLLSRVAVDIERAVYTTVTVKF